MSLRLSAAREERSHGVEHGEDHDADVGEDRRPHIREADSAEEEHEDLTRYLAELRKTLEAMLAEGGAKLVMSV